MQKILLAANFTETRLKALKLVCMQLKVLLKEVKKEELLQPVGYLAGIPGIAPVEAVYSEDTQLAEMIFMSGFTRPDLDRMLAAIKKGSLKEIKLKAMLTPYNASWSVLKLLGEIGQEHAYMHGRKAAKPKHLADQN